jgi:ubiquinone/menaquinone biosynthesis C-methylase UbiE
MNIRQSYTEWSTTYDQDRNLTRDLDGAITREMLANLRCHSVLEIGCGTGKNTTLLSQLSEQVLALDFSTGMLDEARKKLALDNLTFAIADITETWPCRDQSIDLISCNLVLEHVSDLSFIFAEGSRVLRGNGRFLVSELHPFRQYQGTQARFQRDQETTKIPAFVHHISDFIDGAAANHLKLSLFRECWHPQDENKPPRLVSFMFQK